MNGFGSQMVLAVRIAARELRSGLSGLKIFLACLALGVFAIAAVGSFSEALKGGLAAEGQSILGGDVELTLTHQRISAEQLSYLDRRGTVSEVAATRAMARPTDGDARVLVELKAVDGVYPLYGALRLAGGGALDQALANVDGQWGAVVEETLMARLGAEKGSKIRVGEIDLEIRDTIKREPDRVASGMAIGPRVMIAKGALDSTQLVQPGSLVRWRYRVALGDQSENSVDLFKDDLKREFPTAGWRIRDRGNGAPGVRRFVDRLTLFLTLVGLTSLIVGGVGVGNGVKSYLDSKRDNIATLKCLGAPGGLVFRIYLVQVLVLAAVAIAIGLAFGAAAPVLVGLAIEAILPIPARFGVYAEPLLLASAFGLLTTLAFALWPLGRAREVPASALFRDIVAPVRRWPRPIYLAGVGLSLAALAALAVTLADDRRITVFYVAGAAASFLLLWLIAHGLMLLARRMPRLRRPEFRLGISNLHRPGAPTPSVVLSLGLGLTLLVTLSLIDANMSRQLGAQMPDRAPSFFFVDIQSDQVEPFEKMVRDTPGVATVDRVPMLRGRIVRLKDVPVEKANPAPNARWVINGGRNMTYSDTVPSASTLVRGEWWPKDYDGPPLVSFVDELATGLGLDIGDEITVNVLGREITAKIANTRAVEWGSLQINFVIVMSPNALRGAPHTHLATVTMQPEGELKLLRDVSDSFPNITAVRIKEVLEAINGLLAKLLLSIRGASAITLIAGALVLAGAMAAGHRARIYDAVVLKTIGATRGRLMRSNIFEYAVLGAVTAVFAAVAGTISAYMVIRFAMNLDWEFAPWSVVWTVIGATILTVLLGLAGTWRVLGEKAAPVLRSRS